MSPPLNRLRVLAASDAVNACNGKTQQLHASMRVNGMPEWRLEKEHPLTVYGPRQVLAYGDWYVTGRKSVLDTVALDKTTRFLGRVFTLNKALGKRTAELGQWYFETPDADFLVCLSIKKMKVPKHPGQGFLVGLGPQMMVPYYAEIYYVDRFYLEN